MVPSGFVCLGRGSGAPETGPRREASTQAKILREEMLESKSRGGCVTGDPRCGLLWGGLGVFTFSSEVHGTR